MNIRSYADIKNYYCGRKTLLASLEKFYGSNIPEDVKRYEKDDYNSFKAECRKFYRNNEKYNPDPLSVPIRNKEQWRTVSSDDGETCTDFIIIPDKWGDLWGTDDEQGIYDDIEDFVFSTVGYYSAYDFSTGRMITLRWSFKRIPCGVAIVHERGIDW